MFNEFGALVADLQKMWGAPRAGRLAPAVTPEETGYAKLLTKAINARIDGKISIKQLAEFRVKLDRALLSAKRKAAPKKLVKSLNRRVLIKKAPVRPAPFINPLDMQLLRLKVAHIRAGTA